MSTTRIYIVEDEPLIAQELSERVTHLGYEVCGRAARGEQAVEEIPRIRPDLVLMDICLAGEWNGIDTAARLRQLLDVPIIFLSAPSDAHLIEQALGTEPCGYLVKPFEARELHAMIQAALYKHRMECALRDANARLEEAVQQRTAELRQSEAEVRALNENLERLVTERTDTLRASEERYRYWMLTLPGAVYEFCVDAAGHRSLRFISHGIADLTGLSPAEAMADVEVLFQRIPLDALPAMDESMRHSLDTLSPWLHEFPIRDTTGNVKWLRSHAVPRREQDGTTCWTGVLVDITERKQLAEREASRVRQLKKLYELSMTLLGDPGTILKEVVRSIGEVFEVRVVCLSEIVGQELYFRAVYVDGQTFSDAGHCSLAITPCATVEQTKDLRIFDHVMERFPEASFLRNHQAVSYCGFPALDNEGRVVAVTCLLDDKPHEFSKEEQDLLRLFGQRIAVEFERARHDAEQKRLADELRRSQAFLRQIIDMDPNFIFAKDRDGRFILVNKAVADAYGTTVEHLTGKTDADFNANQEEVECFRQKDLEVMDSLHERFISEEVLTDSKGKTHWLQTVKRPILDEQGRAIMVLGASTDITERKRMEDALRQREQELRAAVEERERISHDLHDGILQALFAVGLGLEATNTRLSPGHRTTVGASLEQAIEQLNRVMGEIRNFIAGLGSDLLQGKDFPTALRHMLDSLTAHQATRVRLAVEKRAAQALSVEQALHLFLVVQEAVSNSIRHGRAQAVTVSLKRLTQGIRLRIRDNGRGFNPKAAKGTGHGLRNMAARAQKLGGRLTVVSNIKEGTRIVLDVPHEASHATR